MFSTALGSHLRMALVTYVAAILMHACTVPRAVETSSPAGNHGISFAWPRGCGDDRADVRIVVDGREHHFPPYQEKMIVAVAAGKHTIEQYHGGYLVWRWSGLEVTSNTFLTLRCYAR